MSGGKASRPPPPPPPPPPFPIRYTVIVPDLRGFSGRFDKPATGYDKRTMAQDIHQLVAQLGHQRIFLVGHDTGLMVAYAYAAAHPAEVRRLALLDAPIPGTKVFQELSEARWSGILRFTRCGICQRRLSRVANEYT